jgi:hypothetical protein
MVMAVEKSMSPLTNQKVSNDGANKQPFSIVAKYPVEYENSCENRSMAAARRFELSSNTKSTRSWNGFDVIQSSIETA